jgi:hypothetical protein
MGRAGIKHRRRGIWRVWTTFINLKCCSNFGAIPIIDNKTIGCEPKETEKPEIAGPGS